MLLPVTLMAWDASGLGAGPPTTAPVLMLYWLPWQGQSIVPLEIVATMQPMCVQTALNALKSPEFGWVTTTFSLVKILPLPTGISLVAVSAEPCAPVVLPLFAPPAVAEAEVGADPVPVAG